LRSSKKRPFASLLLAGIERYPLKVSRRMSNKKIASRSHIKPFLKIVNVTHVMPTRYGLDIDLKSVVTENKVYGEKQQRSRVRNKVSRLFEERYKAGKNRWFFTKLRF
jgi:large subunit ribosomal protein L27e